LEWYNSRNGIGQNIVSRPPPPRKKGNRWRGDDRLLYHRQLGADCRVPRPRSAGVQPGENGHINAQSAAWACLPRDMKSGVATTRVASPTSNAVPTKLFAVRNSSKRIQEGNYGGLISGRQPIELANADSKLERPEKSQHPGLIGGRQPIELANGVRGLPCMSLDRFVESE